jgi:hypothetical protein
MKSKDLNLKVFRSDRETGMAAYGVHYRRWGIDAGQARNVKPHIDLMLKLHKKLRKDCPARTNAQ